MAEREPFEWMSDFLDQLYGETTHTSWDAVEKCLEPLINIEDREDSIVVTVDLPCVERKEDIEVNVTENTLEVRARMTKPVRWERWGTIQKDLEFTSFKKFVRLPDKVRPEGARAAFKNGVLRVLLQKMKPKFMARVE